MADFDRNVQSSIIILKISVEFLKSLIVEQVLVTDEPTLQQVTWCQYQLESNLTQNKKWW